jgi:hypothetical protein
MIYTEQDYDLGSLEEALKITSSLLPSIALKETMARLWTVWCMLIPSLCSMLRRYKTCKCPMVFLVWNADSITYNKSIVPIGRIEIQNNQDMIDSKQVVECCILKGTSISPFNVVNFGNVFKQTVCVE